jgi:hypothetical protein
MTTWKDSLERRDEVKAAYIEGHLAAFEFEAGCVSEGAKQQAEADWNESDARKRLENPLDS